MTKDEALKLALETLEYAGPSWIDARQPAITAIKEALMSVPDGAQPEQEPWSNVEIGVDVTKEGVSVVGIYKISNDSSHLFYSQFYTTPLQRPSRSDIKPLTDEETYKIQTSVGYSGGFSRFVGIVRAIEAAHGIKEEA